MTTRRPPTPSNGSAVSRGGSVVWRATLRAGSSAVFSHGSRGCTSPVSSSSPSMPMRTARPARSARSEPAIEARRECRPRSEERSIDAEGPKTALRSLRRDPSAAAERRWRGRRDRRAPPRLAVAEAVAIQVDEVERPPLVHADPELVHELRELPTIEQRRRWRVPSLRGGRTSWRMDARQGT